MNERQMNEKTQTRWLTHEPKTASCSPPPPNLLSVVLIKACFPFYA